MKTITAIIMDVLLVCFSVSVLTWTAVGIQTMAQSRKEEKRREQADKREAELHAKRMRTLG